MNNSKNDSQICIICFQEKILVLFKFCKPKKDVDRKLSGLFHSEKKIEKKLLNWNFTITYTNNVENFSNSTNSKVQL